jgi:pimeloyl-ACP methyl ester carboxylesterase
VILLAAWMAVLVVRFPGTHAGSIGEFCVVAPDYPGLGHSGTPANDDYDYTFVSYINKLWVEGHQVKSESCEALRLLLHCRNRN